MVKDLAPFARNLAKLPFYGFEQWGTNKQSAANKTQTIASACTLHKYSCKKIDKLAIFEENKLEKHFISSFFVPKIGYCQHLILYLVMSTFNCVTNKRSRANKLSTLCALCCRGALYAVAEEYKTLYAVSEESKNTNIYTAERWS